MADDGEHWGRVLHEARMVYEEKTGHRFSLPWEQRAPIAREEDEAIGAAVAAQAVAAERAKLAGIRSVLLEGSQDAATARRRALAIICGEEGRPGQERGDEKDGKP